MSKRIFVLVIFILLVSVNGISAQDQGSTLQAWADTPSSAFNLSQQIAWPDYAGVFTAVNTYTAAGDPTLSCAPGGHSYSAWATFVAPVTRTVEIGAWGSAFDSVVAVFKNTPTSELKCVNDSDQPSTFEEISFKVVAGTRYYLMFAAVGTGAGVAGNSGHIFNIKGNSQIYLPIQIPASGSYSFLQSKIERIDPSFSESIASCGSVTHMVFYRFKPAVSGRYEFSTAGSSYDTTLAVEYDLGGPSVGCNRDVNSETVSSRLRPTLSAGVTYLIAIGQDTASVNPQDDDMVLSLRVRKL